jgi:hypothetical protein
MTDQNDVKSSLLQPLDTSVVSATTTPFTIRDYFKRIPGVKFSTIWDEFKRRFFDKTESPNAEVTYQKYKLLHVSADGPIIAALGGESKAAGTVNAAMTLLKRQSNGGPGFLQTNGYANIFYARDKKDALCAIRIGWAQDGWVIDAISVQDPLAWNGKHEIFCPISDR